ncbi:3-hydroxy-2-methylbutyryl-CoA dehydrogenase [Pseudohongiella acticola]|uniref:2,3-dihydroxy-2,3-dihydro-p-cumate dehydrogenase n=1 Tax=Pseudohongiella acticola TaxID=1524254 RepID=A0A1E8CNQ1_9GAMM|nr:SDR family NAD(P)-dependent oxidoreductase [Pseudohongiella acticola]OFE13872.1 3-hydroxy-2-methylbutyryl-CoA dehydrogenase [Pseudohongiella acticola]
MQLKEKTAFITGAASGLGLAAAQRFIAEGANVMLFDLDADRAQAVASELGSRASWSAGDVSDESQVEAAVQKTLATFGSLHVNVNSAGIGAAAKTVGRDGPMPQSQFERVIRVNLLGTFNVLRLCAAAMQKNDAQTDDSERGVIINVASVAAYDGQMGQAAYSASKGGIAAMTLPIARDLARDGIRVMTVAPGIFATPLMQASPQPVKDALVDMIQFPKRMGLPEEFADLACHIVSSSYLNGEVIRLDAAIRMAAR